MLGRSHRPLTLLFRTSLTLAAAVLAPAALGQSSKGFDNVGRPFLETHCVRCHDAEVAQADLRLDGATPERIAAEREDWDWLLERVEFGEMPPAGEAQPTDEERERFVRWLRRELDSKGASNREPLPLAPLRRLTRIEVQHAVRDLFGVPFEAWRHLPEDAVGHGFDHVAEAQSLSEADFERYLAAAEMIAERAVPVDGDAVRSTRVEAEGISGQGVHGGASWLWSNSTAWATVSLPRKGQYRVVVTAHGGQAGPDPIEVALRFEGGDESAPLTVPFDEDAPGTVEAVAHAPRAGDVRIGVRFLNDYFRKASGGKPKQDRNLAIRSIEIIGPTGDAEPTEFSARWLERIEKGGKGQRGLKRAVLDLARVVWRSPELKARDVAPLLALSERGDPADVRLRGALVGMLVSPRFLFLHESARGSKGPRGARPLETVDVLTRLTTTLWASVPDGELIERALAADLTKERAQRAFAEEMLRSPRADAFVRRFGEQWLQLRGFERKRADRDRYPEWNRDLARSMRQETERVLIDSLRERRSLWDLVDGDATFVDRRLAEHYGIDGYDGDAGGWQRVSLEGTPRRGLVGHGSVLFSTSEATRTSPVRRGKWVLDVLLGSAPPPPPPGADNLKPVKKGADAMSLRARLEQHRQSPSCLSCHSRMDPIGFGLEGFDAIGRRRAEADGVAVDATGTLPDGRSFDGPVELAAVLRQEDRFLEALARRLCVFALGRGLERADRGLVARVVDALDPEHPTFEQAILAVLTSDEFRRLRAE